MFLRNYIGLEDLMMKMMFRDLLVAMSLLTAACSVGEAGGNTLEVSAADFDALVERVDQLEAENDKLRNTLDSDNGISRAEFETVKNDVAMSAGFITSLQSDVEGLGGDVESISARVTVLEPQVGENTDAIETVNAIAAVNAAEIDGLQVPSINLLDPATDGTDFAFEAITRAICTMQTGDSVVGDCQLGLLAGEWQHRGYTHGSIAGLDERLTDAEMRVTATARHTCENRFSDSIFDEATAATCEAALSQGNVIERRPNENMEDSLTRLDRVEWAARGAAQAACQNRHGTNNRDYESCRGAAWNGVTLFRQPGTSIDEMLETIDSVSQSPIQLDELEGRVLVIEDLLPLVTFEEIEVDPGMLVNSDRRTVEFDTSLISNLPEGALYEVPIELDIDMPVGATMDLFIASRIGGNDYISEEVAVSQAGFEDRRLVVDFHGVELPPGETTLTFRVIAANLDGFGLEDAYIDASIDLDRVQIEDRREDRLIPETAIRVAQKLRAEESLRVSN